MNARLTLAAACLAAFVASPAYAAGPAASPDPDEKLPAQLPSVTIQGNEVTNGGVQGTKLAPTAQTTSRVRLPEPNQRRATSENNRALMVNVTPTTLEQPPELPGTHLPYTSLTAGYGPLTQYRLGLYDARTWGPVLGLTDLAGHAGWDWSGWHGEETLDWAGIGRAELQATGFGWDKVGNHGTQTYFAGSVDHEQGPDWSAGIDLDRGYMNALQAGTAAGDVTEAVGRARGRWHPATSTDHQPQVDATLQDRQWGIQSGVEGYVNVQDFWSLSDQVQLEGALGGGYWGREPILDPQVAFHYRPSSNTHLYASLQTASELPDFSALYLERSASGANNDLQAERVEGWAKAGASHRLSDALWGSVDVGLRRSFRHVYWADPNNTGLWTPTNAAGEQWSPTGGLRVQYQFTDGPMLELGYAGATVMPLGTADHAVEGRVDASFLEKKLDVSVGLEGKYSGLSTLQRPGGGSASGVFAKAQAVYQLTHDWSVGIHASDVPLVLDATGTTYFAPNPWLTIDARYQF